MDKKQVQFGGLGVPPSMSNYDHLKDTLEAAQDELVELLRDRQILDWRIDKLQNDIIHLAALCRVEIEDPLRQLGLTDAIRWALSSEKRPLSVLQIADMLKRSNYDVSDYKNLPANIQTIVTRLVKAGDVEALPVTPPLTVKTFHWVGDPFTLAPPPTPVSKDIAKKSR
jgi:hypothetical protein